MTTVILMGLVHLKQLKNNLNGSPKMHTSRARAAYCLEKEVYMLASSIDLILKDTESPSVALRRMYETYKTTDKKYSTEYFSRRMGMASRGNFHCMMQGKRPIGSRYWDSMCKAFNLNETQTTIFIELLEKRTVKKTARNSDSN